jgi:fused signal recognition particle receptor
MEDALIRADVGVDTAIALVAQVRQARPAHLDAAAHSLRQALTSAMQPSTSAPTAPPGAGLFALGKTNLYLVVGVNGAGKTTFIGKWAHRLGQQGHRVLIGAGDTFRAAAEAQLSVWAQRASADLVMRPGADPSSVLYDTIQRGVAEGYPAIVMDTAGRLQNKFNLMEELRKVRHTIDKARPEGSVVHAWLVLDATVGQNALQQAKVFAEAVAPLTGVVLTKLDGSAKGGVVVPVVAQLGQPVVLVGTGEQVSDLHPFDAEAFATALLEAQK